MVKQWRNEDIIAPADAQRWEDGVDKSLKENVQNAGDLKKHAEDRSNPHGVTAAQTGAYTKEESNANDQETLTAAKQYTDEKKQEANTFTSQEVAKVKTDIQNGNVASASKLNTARKINGVDFDGTKDINVTANPNQRTIPANTNLDDLIEPGFWTSHNNGNTATLTNAPFGVNTFTLQVGTGLENGRIFQTAKSMGDGSVAVRRKREDTQWSGWVRLARADGTTQTGLFSEAANMLRTSRRIAGVAFDGTADISIPAGNVGAYTKAEADTKVAAAKSEVISGNVASATKLQTARTISLTGGVTGSTTFDGSGNASISATVAGNAPSATRLATPRKIAGVDFDGTRDISISAENVGAYTKNETDINIANEINKFGNSLSIDVRNLLLGTAEPLVIVGNNTLNQTGYRYTFTFGRLRDIPAKVGDPIAIAFDWEVTGTTVGGRFFPQFSDQPYNVAGRENIAVSNSNRSGTSSFVTAVQSSWLETNATSAGMGFRADELQGTLTITNLRFLSASRDSGWLPAASEFAYKDDLAVGARNYLVNSENPSASSWTSVFGSTAVCRQVPTFNNGITRVSKVNGSTEEVYYRFMNTGDGNLSSTLLEEGKTYTLSIDVRAGLVGSDRIAFRGQYRLASGNWISLENWAALDFSQKVNGSDFSRVSHSFLIPKGAQSLYFSIQLYNNAGTIPSDGSWMEFKKAHLGQGKIVVDGGPAPEEMALKNDLEETQQKVQTLEENTIRLTNQFPDHDFSKQLPRPVAESGITVTYNNQGVVFDNATNNQGRVYWGSPPLGLTVGKKYNVSMYVNSSASSVGKAFIVGTSNGENFAFSPTDSEPFWIQGTIGLTHWTAFSIWVPPSSAIRIRELYIYEANTDITTARIEQLEKEIERLSKDNSLPPWEPRFEPGFMNYSGVGGIWHCQVERRGDQVALSGAIANSVEITTTGFDKILMARLPVGYRPKKTVNRVTAGSGRAILNIEIDPTGEVWMARYRGASTWDYSPVNFVGAWLNVGMTYLGEDI